MLNNFLNKKGIIYMIPKSENVINNLSRKYSNWPEISLYSCNLDKNPISDNIWHAKLSENFSLKITLSKINLILNEPNAT